MHNFYANLSTSMLESNCLATKIIPMREYNAKHPRTDIKRTLQIIYAILTQNSNLLQAEAKDKSSALHLI